jgi:hypothetical protein
VKFYEASLASPEKRRELEADLKKRFRQSQLFMKTFQVRAPFELVPVAVRVQLT